jgi:hypothetical protein
LVTVGSLSEVPVVDGTSERERLFDEAESIDEPEVDRMRFLLIVSSDGEAAGDGSVAILDEANGK